MPAATEPLNPIRPTTSSASVGQATSGTGSAGSGMRVTVTGEATAFDTVSSLAGFQHAHHRVGHAHGLVGALPLDREALHELPPAVADVVDRDDRHPTAHAGA